MFLGANPRIGNTARFGIESTNMNNPADVSSCPGTLFMPFGSTFSKGVLRLTSTDPYSGGNLVIGNNIFQTSNGWFRNNIIIHNGNNGSGTSNSLSASSDVNDCIWITSSSTGNRSMSNNTLVIGGSAYSSVSNSTVIGANSNIQAGASSIVLGYNSNISGVGNSAIIIGSGSNISGGANVVVIGHAIAGISGNNTTILNGNASSSSANVTNIGYNSGGSGAAGTGSTNLGFYAGSNNAKNGSLNLGYYARAQSRGEIQFNTGNWSDGADYGTGVSFQSFQRQTTNATPAELFVPEGTDTNTPTTYNVIPTFSSNYFEVTLVGRVPGTTDRCAFKFDFMVSRESTAASTTIDYVPTITAIYATAALSTASVAVTADTTNGRPAISVTGVAATTIRWTGNARITRSRTAT